MNSSSRNGATVIWLAVHTTEGIMRAADLRAWTAWPGSSHASNDETGVLMTPAEGFVPYNLAAWTLRNGNPISENIEQCGWARWTRAEWLARPKLLDTTARWLADRSKARGIPLVRLSDADIRARKPGVLGHGDYSRATGDGTHTDPGLNYPWDVVLDTARAYAAGQTPEEDMPLTDADAIKVAKAVHDLVLNRAGGQTGTTTLAATLAYLDANLGSLPKRTADEVFGRTFTRQGSLSQARWGEGSQTSLGAQVEWNDEATLSLGIELTRAVAEGNAQAIAAAIPAALTEQVAQGLAERLQS